MYSKVNINNDTMPPFGLRPGLGGITNGVVIRRLRLTRSC
jgi:hypothetical protein